MAGSENRLSVPRGRLAPRWLWRPMALRRRRGTPQDGTRGAVSPAVKTAHAHRASHPAHPLQILTFGRSSRSDRVMVSRSLSAADVARQTVVVRADAQYGAEPVVWLRRHRPPFVIRS